MSVDDRASQLRRQIDAGLDRLIDELLEAAVAQREEAHRAARAAVDAEVATAVAGAVRNAEAQANQMLAERVASERAQADLEREQAVSRARLEAEAQASHAFAERIAALQATAEAERAQAVASALRQAEADAHRLLEQRLHAVREEAGSETAAREAAIRAEIEAGVATRIAEARAEAAAEQATRVAEGRAQERQADLACFSRLLEGVVALDEATTLSAILDALGEHATAEAGRSIVMLVRGDRARGWRAHGFGTPIDVRTIDVPLDSPDVTARAARQGQRTTTATAAGEERAESPLGLITLPPDRVGFAVPVIVGGKPVAVVYADDANAAEPNVPSAWPEAVEVLARHAGRCLETLTMARAYGLQGVAAGKPAEPGQAAAAASVPGAADRTGEDEDAARRCARLLISEIKLYHESEVNAGRREGDLLRRLSIEIARARTFYEARVPDAVRARTDYFRQELIRTLANGDERLLGAS